ncbi:uncharacterized protein EI90DRAFT_3125669 [Cantharellus anzutake]|uniref:uncharacterized protein n=1 Tax=Cantharellus anzutake TaxID=1750568 RepID=UPI0019066EE4|nr:uncharacterized protein EI90DRAFT_3125669 [Cantharellus anzutake]KAF8328919.1 hypothetical protein EI90DRAFT_3125669 [Cantharellus anzutake]
MLGMQEEEIYPDGHLGKISDNNLWRALGLRLGPLQRFHAAASEFWNWKVEKQHASDPPNSPPNPMASSSSAGQKRKAPDDDWAVVMYRQKYKDGRDPTYDDGRPVFNIPISQNNTDMWDQFVEEQEKLHNDKGVEDYVMVAEGGYWMHIPPTRGGFFNPITDNPCLYTHDDDPFLL